MVKTTHNAEESMEFAIELAKSFKGGEVLALHGDLGGGKTTFTKGLAEALMVNENITSPTFVMLKVYPAKIGAPSTSSGQVPSTSSGQVKKIQFVHIDVYRAETIEDIKSVGIEDYLNRDDVILVIEWAEKIETILPKNAIHINFNHVDENTREIEVDHDFDD